MKTDQLVWRSVGSELTIAAQALRVADHILQEGFRA
jgi:hypothetical protein